MVLWQLHGLLLSVGVHPSPIGMIVVVVVVVLRVRHLL
jgi:hypothetical protein